MEEENALRQVGVMNFAWQSMGIEKKIFVFFFNYLPKSCLEWMLLEEALVFYL
jgi:hypothetical protein